MHDTCRWCAVHNLTGLIYMYWSRSTKFMLVACWLKLPELWYCHLCSYRLRDLHIGDGVCSLVINITGAKSIMTYFLIIQKHQMMISVFPLGQGDWTFWYVYDIVCMYRYQVSTRLTILSYADSNCTMNIGIFVFLRHISRFGSYPHSTIVVEASNSCIEAAWTE